MPSAPGFSSPINRELGDLLPDGIVTIKRQKVPTTWLTHSVKSSKIPKDISKIDINDNAKQYQENLVQAQVDFHSSLLDYICELQKKSEIKMHY